MYYFDYRKDGYHMSLSTQGYTYWQNKPSFQLATDTDSHWIMYIIETGKCKFQFSQYQGVAKANDILLIPPYISFQRQMITPMTFHFIRITSNLALNNPLIGHHHFVTSRFIDNCTMLRKTNFNFSNSAELIRSHVINDFLIQEELTRLQTNQYHFIHLKSKTVANAINLMQHNLTLSINTIAQNSDVNAAYFSRLFKKVTGETPISFYTKLKLKKVQELLITTEFSLTEIADQTGFNDAFYLSRVFSQYLQYSPSEFRKKHII